MTNLTVKLSIIVFPYKDSNKSNKHSLFLGFILRKISHKNDTQDIMFNVSVDIGHVIWKNLKYRQKTIHEQHFSMKKNEIELRVHFHNKTVPQSFHSHLSFVSELFLT